MLGACVSDPLIKSTCSKSGYCVCVVTILKQYCVMGGASFRVGIMDQFKTKEHSLEWCFLRSNPALKYLFIKYGRLGIHCTYLEVIVSKILK